MMKYRGIYIRNIEAVDAIKLEFGEKKYLESKWTGYIPYSLELLKLKNEGLEIIRKKETIKVRDKDFLFDNDENKLKSLDLINVNFTTGYKQSEIAELERQRKEYKKDKDTDKVREINNLILELKEKLKEENKLLKLGCADIRKKLYKNGFRDANGNEYVLYKRSGSKARQGKVMFIRKDLADRMLKWGRMNIDIPENKKVDVVSLGAYTSLVSSSIEDTIKINPDNILIIKDIYSEWSEDCKWIYKNSEGTLDVEVKKLEDRKSGDKEFLNSECTDGSCLLEATEYFEDGIDFKLLRNHMFKSCAFKTYIQLYYKDYCYKNNINYDTFEVEDMFGNKMLAKDVKLICTPNSLKALKFSEYVEGNSKAAMFDYWKKIVKSDDNIFGVCKHNHPSKWSFDGLEYNQMSYQMINSMPLTYNDIRELTEWEVSYVEKLKTDIEEFKKYLKLKSSMINANEVMLALLEKNKDFEKCDMFRDFRTDTISKYVNKLKSGKIKNIGDYCTIIANPVSYLKQSLGIYKEEEIELKGNEIYTKLFDTNKELICFRNPHTSQANVYLGKNTYVEEIDRYCNFGRNIVVVNAIKNSIFQIMSGADVDSDNCLIYDNETLIKVGKNLYESKEYLVCENKINKSSKLNILTNEAMSITDNTLARSKMTIGSVVNLGQLLMSEYWTMHNKKFPKEQLDKQQKLIDIACILNGMCIDNAKKSFDIDINREINNLRKEEKKVRDLLYKGKKPNFWRYVSKDKDLKTKEGRRKKLAKYNTPMDILQEVLSNEIKSFAGTNNTGNVIKFINFLDLSNIDKNKADRKAEKKVAIIVEDLDEIIKDGMAKINIDDDEGKEIILNDLDNEVRKALRNYGGKLSKNTIGHLLILIAGEGQEQKIREISKVRLRLMSYLYRKNPEVFIGLIKNHKSLIANVA